MKLMKTLFIFLCTSQIIIAQEKILIITCSHNRPDLIAIQAKTFQAFMQDEYEFIVFDDAPNAVASNAIKKMCKKMSVGYKKIPQEVHLASNKKQVGNSVRSGIPIYIDEDRSLISCRAGDSIDYAMQTVGFKHPGIVCIVDSDLFLIKKFSIAKFMQDYDLYGCIQQRDHIRYVWCGLVFLNNATLPNKDTLSFDCGKIDGVNVDTGGQTYCYLQENKSVRLGFYSNTHIDDLPKDLNELYKLGYDSQEAEFIMNNPSRMEFHSDNHFLHYCAGGNWDNLSKTYHVRKTQVLNKFIDAILNRI